jgi:hypothetical protein
MKPASKTTQGAADSSAAKAAQKKTTTAAKRAAAPAAAPPKVGVTKKAVAAKTAKVKETAAPAKAPRAKKSVPPTTAIKLVARVDVGLGNTLYFRGWGGGLRWDVGLPALCVAEDLWELQLLAVTEPVHFKVLINDMIWSDGPDLTAFPNGQLEFNPAFG